MTASDIPGNNGFGIYPHIKDQPVLADGIVRYRGEAVVASDRRSRDATDSIRDEELPIEWEPREAVIGIAAAVAAGAPALHSDKPDNVLIEGLVQRGDVDAGLAAGEVVCRRHVRDAVRRARLHRAGGGVRATGRRSGRGDRVDADPVHGSLPRSRWSWGSRPSRYASSRRRAAAAFGGKLDMAVQPLVASAAWILDRPIRAVYTRPESMASSTKRHPSLIDERDVLQARWRADRVCDSTATSTPAPTPPGDPRWPAGSPFTRPAPTSCPT